MSIQDAARAALKYFSADEKVATPDGTFPLPTVMVAIAGGESGWQNDARGDYGLWDRPRCNGYTSFGLWQINTIHSSWLRNATGSADPCVWAQWLYNPENNARAARALYDGAGFKPWTVWNTGAYRRYLGQAQAAVAEELKKKKEQGGLAPVPVLLILLGLNAVIFLGIALSPTLRGKVEELWKKRPKGSSLPELPV